MAFRAVKAGYSGYVSVAPAPIEPVTSGKYKQGSFAFSAPLKLAGPDDLLFLNQDLEPRAAFDGLGNIYVAAIQGTPAGTDVWKSMDGGSSFSYLGQPDGAQAAAALGGRGGGLGGGDEDIVIGSSGRVYVASLFGVERPLTLTMSSSSNGGGAWVVNPLSQTFPVVDRQWLASRGDNELYMTFQQEGVLLVGTNSLFCVKSTDGGITFPQITEITTPEIGVQPGFQGNLAIDPRNGYLYNVFVGHLANELYLARSTDGGKSFIIGLIYRGPIGTSVSYVFPIISVDRGGNPHVVFSNGHNIYLTSSPDAGASWTTPVRVNNGADSKTSISPWIDAGDAGKVDIMWWGTSASNNLDANAQWKVGFAQVLNAFAKTPTITQNPVTGVFHSGPICVNGTGCASGTRSLAEYASTTVYRDGRAMIVFPDDKNNAQPQTYFTKQTNGPSIISQNGSIAARGEIPRPKKPDRYWLEPNFPNPFNPVTTIRYSIPDEGLVSVSVFNLLGQEIRTLVNVVQGPGEYAIRFDASDLPSGMYYYRLTSGGYTSVRKLLFLK